ncbi:hypothetical protein GBA52_019345 [Prunus armeniaca]|nr:hypothetical protein GBA52_019345 [Prunus armeniaca]
MMHCRPSCGLVDLLLQSPTLGKMREISYNHNRQMDPGGTSDFGSSISIIFHARQSKHVTLRRQKK